MMRLTFLTKTEMKRYSIEQFMATTSLLGASFSADEKRILFSSNETGIFNAYTLPVGGGGSEPLTRSAVDSIFSVSFFPCDDRVLFTKDWGGNENFHLFVLAPDGTENGPDSGGRAQSPIHGVARRRERFLCVKQ